MPVSVKIGRYTTRMMITPNTLGRITSRVASRTMASRSGSSGRRFNRACSAPSRRKQFSTMITAPSTMRPKSSAPRLMRLPETREPTMPVMVHNIAIGNDGRRHERRAHVAQQREQHRDDQQRAFGQVARHRRDGRIDQRGPVVDRFRLDARRQRRLDLLEALGRCTRHCAAVLAHEHEDSSEDDLLPVLRRCAGAQLMANLDVRHLRQTHRDACSLRDDDVVQVFDGGDLPRRADQVLGAVALDVARADVLVVVGDRCKKSSNVRS